MLSNEQNLSFRENGFVTIHGLYTQKEIKAITTWIDEVENYPEVPNKYMMYFEQSKLDENQRTLSKIEYFEPYHAGFNQLFREVNMLFRYYFLSETPVIYKEVI